MKQLYHLKVISTPARGCLNDKLKYSKIKKVQFS